MSEICLKFYFYNDNDSTVYVAVGNGLFNRIRKLGLICLRMPGSHTDVSL